MVSTVSRGSQAGRVLGLFVLVLAVAAGGFFAGWWVANSGLSSNALSPEALQQQAESAQQDARRAREELDVLATRAAVDRQALELLRRDMVGHEERAMELEDDLRFYRGLMAPVSGDGGVSLREPEIVPGPAEGQFAYRLIVQQIAAKHALVKGNLSAVLEGTYQGQAQSHPLATLDAEPEEGLPPLKFRYFQSLSGEITLPDGFVAQRLTVTAQITKPRKFELREHFPWQIQERFSNVGK